MQSHYKGYYTSSSTRKDSSPPQNASNSSDATKRPLEQYSNNNSHSEQGLNSWANGSAHKVFKPEYNDDNHDFEYDTGGHNFTGYDKSHDHDYNAEYDNSHDFEYDSSYDPSSKYSNSSDVKLTNYGSSSDINPVGYGYRTTQQQQPIVAPNCLSTTTTSTMPSTTTSTTSVTVQSVRPSSPPVILNQPVFQTTYHSNNWASLKQNASRQQVQRENVRQYSGQRENVRQFSGRGENLRQFSGRSNADSDALTELWPWEASRSNAGWVGATVTKQKINFYSGPPADVFATAKKVQGGFGAKMMERMGWSDGEGLGKHRQGEPDLISFDYQRDKKGLRAEEEDKAHVAAVEVKQKRQKSAFSSVKSSSFWKWQGSGMKEDLKTVMKRNKQVKAVKSATPDYVPTDLSAKHPVSALMELCSKRRWGEPLFSTVSDTGDSHRRKFLMKVQVGGKWYQPSEPSDNKKLAKSSAAKACLEQMGLLGGAGSSAGSSHIEGMGFETSSTKISSWKQVKVDHLPLVERASVFKTS